jgi:WD40 repeat protein
VLRGHEGSVFSAAFSPDGSRIVTTSDDETARIWDAATGKEIEVLAVEPAPR